MKKFLAVFFITTFLGISAFAASSDSVLLTGTITSVTNVAFSSATADFALDYSGAGGFITGDVTLTSNRKAYTVKLSSTNNGLLLNEDYTDSQIPYKVKVVVGTSNPIAFATGTIVNELTGYTTPTTAPVTAMTAANYRTPAAGKTFKLDFITNYTGSTILEGVAYTDTLTVTIIAG